MKKYRNLLEELTFDQKRIIDSYGYPKKAQEIAGHVMKSDTIYLPLENHENPSEVMHPDVVSHLQKHEFKIPTMQEYKAGYGVDKHNRIASIGKTLRKTKASAETLKSFENDPIRAASNNEHMVAITHNPYHVGGMSTDRGWTSCMNMAGGCKSYNIEHDIAQGTHAAYLIHKNDKEIKNPIARIALKPFSATEGEAHTIIHPEDMTYGTANSKFKNTVASWAKTHFTPKEDVTYEKHPDVFSDTSNFLMRPSEKSIQDVVGRKNHSQTNSFLRMANSPEINEKVYHFAKSRDLGMDTLHNIASHEHTPEHIVHSHVDSLTPEDTREFTNAGIDSHKLSNKNISKIFDSHEGKELIHIPSGLLHHSGLTSKHVNKIIDFAPDKIKRVSPNAINSEHIHKIIDRNILSGMHNISRSPEIAKEHTDKLFKSAKKENEPKYFHGLPAHTSTGYKNIEDVRKFHSHFGNYSDEIANHYSNHPEKTTADVDQIINKGLDLNTPQVSTIKTNILRTTNPAIAEHALNNKKFTKDLDLTNNPSIVNKFDNHKFLSNYFMADETPIMNHEHIGINSKFDKNMIEHENKSPSANIKREAIMSANRYSSPFSKHDMLSSALKHGKEIGNNELFNKHAVEYAKGSNITKEHYDALPVEHQKTIHKLNAGIV